MENKQNKYLEQIIDQIVEYSKMNFESRLEIVEDQDIDYFVHVLAVGVNIIGEELEHKVQELERRNSFINSVTAQVPEIIFVYDSLLESIKYLNKCFSTDRNYPCPVIIMNLERPCTNCQVKDTLNDLKYNMLIEAIRDNEIKVTSHIHQTEKWFKTTVNEFEKNNIGETITTLHTISDITILKKNEETIINTLKEKELLLQEKELLLREIHHRVKNNLQVLVNVLNFNENELPESRESFGDIAKRVKGMARIQELIYKHDDLANMDLATYCMKLCNMLSSIYSEDEVIVGYDMNPGLIVDMEKARHIGSFVNEAIINCYKHLFISSGGSIKVSLKDKAGLYIIEIKGQGDYKSVQKSTNSLGQKLMDAFARQLKGTLEKHTNDGYTVTLSFPN